MKRKPRVKPSKIFGYCGYKIKCDLCEEAEFTPNGDFCHYDWTEDPEDINLHKKWEESKYDKLPTDSAED